MAALMRLFKTDPAGGIPYANFISEIFPHPYEYVAQEKEVSKLRFEKYRHMNKRIVETKAVNQFTNADGKTIFRHVIRTWENKYGNLREAFRHMDCDCSSEITMAELEKEMNSQNMPPGIQTRLLDFLDDDKSGTISLSEFLAKARESMFAPNAESNIDSFGHDHKTELKQRQILRDRQRQLRAKETEDGAAGQTRRTTDDIFQLLMAKVQEDPDYARQVFVRLDKDGTGSIDAKELQTALEELGTVLDEATCEQVVTMFDSDGDGTVSVDEFIDFFMRETNHTQEHLKIKGVSGEEFDAIEVFGAAGAENFFDRR